MLPARRDAWAEAWIDGFWGEALGSVLYWKDRQQGKAEPHLAPGATWMPW